ncbi:MAG: hypothetical protein OCD01_03795 [Fibrobacterales bacterium]
MKPLLLILTFMFTTPFAFDGERQGLLIGIGAGVSHNTLRILDVQDKEHERSTYTHTYIPSRIGYAWSNTKAILLYGAVIETTFGYTGINYQQWFNEETQSNFWFVGLGPLRESYDSYIVKGTTPKNPNYGLAINCGFGRELVSHFSFEINGLLGYIKSGELSPKHQIYSGVSMSVSLLGY